MSDTSTQPTPLTPQQHYDAALAALTAKQRKFVRAYLDCLNASRAAAEAGYSEKTAGQIGYENLKKPEIAKAVHLGMSVQAMPAEEILARLSMQARGDMGDFLRVDEEDVTIQTVVTFLTPEEEVGALGDTVGFIRGILPDDGAARRAATIQTATVKRAVARLDLLAAGRAGKLANIKKYTLDPDSGKVSLELYSAKDALELLGKHRKLWGDDGAGGIMKHLDLSRLTSEQLERLSTGDDPYAVLLGQ